MKFKRKLKPSKVVGTRGQVPAIQGAMVRLERVPTRKPGGSPGEMVPKDHLVLYATNAYSFIRVDLGVKDNMDEPGPIPAIALKHLERGVHGDLGLDRIKVGITEYQRVLADAPHADVSGAKFPDFETVIYDRWKDPQGSNILTLDVNPRLLLDAAEAIGSPEEVQITLDLRDFEEYESKVLSPEEKKKVKGKRRRWYNNVFKIKARTKSHEDEDAVGFVMPMKPFGTGVDESGGAFRRD